MVGSLDNAENAKRNFFFDHPISRSVLTATRSTLGRRLRNEDEGMGVRGGRKMLKKTPTPVLAVFQR